MPVHLLSLPNWREYGLAVVEYLSPFSFATAARILTLSSSNCRQFLDRQNQFDPTLPSQLLLRAQTRSLHPLSR